MVRSSTQKRQANERRWLEALYDRWTVQEEQADVNYIRLAKEIGATPAPFQKAVQTYKEVGALITRLVYDRGRRSFWLLALPRDEALARLDAHHRQEIETMTAERAEPEATKLVASVGDHVEHQPFQALKPMRRDEQEALIGAARQYAARKEILRETIAQLERAGIKANSEAFEFTHDDRLEAIMLVLPAIDRLETQVTNLERRIEAYGTQQRPLREEITRLENENRTLRRLLEGKVASNVGDARLVPAE